MSSPPSSPGIKAASPLSLVQVLGRSLFPWSALVLIAGTLWWGPWITLIFALAWWKVVIHLG